MTSASAEAGKSTQNRISLHKVEFGIDSVATVPAAVLASVGVSQPARNKKGPGGQGPFCSRCNFREGLEGDPRSELHNARVGGTRDLTEYRADDVAARVAELRMIESIECFQAQLKVHVFINLCMLG